MAILLYHCICRRHRHYEHRLEDLGLAAAFLHLCHHVPVLYVPRGMLLPERGICVKY
jgi:hypothetical protein